MCRGYRWALEEAGQPARSEWVLQEPSAHPDFTDPLREPTALAKRYLKMAPEVDAVVCADDYLAQGLIRAARKVGRSVPGDLKVTGVDDNTAQEKGAPALTSYHVPFEEKGAKAFAILQAMLQSEAPVDLENRLRGTVVVRESA
jgi:DNA-binding LacI/PurR family transcriptional regulator